MAGRIREKACSRCFADVGKQSLAMQVAAFSRQSICCVNWIPNKEDKNRFQFEKRR